GLVFAGLVLAGLVFGSHVSKDYSRKSHFDKSSKHFFREISDRTGACALPARSRDRRSPARRRGATRTAWVPLPCSSSDMGAAPMSYRSATDDAAVAEALPASQAPLNRAVSGPPRRSRLPFAQAADVADIMRRDRRVDRPD